MMKTSIFLFAWAIIFAGCDKPIEKNSPLSTIDVAFEVQIIDKNGTDLLDPNNDSNPKYVDTDGVNVTDVSASSAVEAFETPANSNHPAPEHFVLLSPDDKQDRYRIRFYFNPFYRTSTLLISFKDVLAPDTLQGEIQKPITGKFVCTSIQHNNEEVWNQVSSNDKERNIVLTLD